jgi:hypothetical protein
MQSKFLSLVYEIWLRGTFSDTFKVDSTYQVPEQHLAAPEQMCALFKMAVFYTASPGHFLNLCIIWQTGD